MWDYRISFLAPEGQEVALGTPVLGFDATEPERRLRERQTESEEAAKKIEPLSKDLTRERMQAWSRLPRSCCPPVCR